MMEIGSKEDFVFLTANALKNIAVSGRPLPIRHAEGKGELAMLGEDEAYLREMIQERRCFGSARSFSDDMPSSLEEDSFSDDRRILRVSDDVDEEHQIAEDILKNGSEAGSWIDPDALSESAGTLVVGSSGRDQTASESSESERRINDAIRAYDSGQQEAFAARKNAEDDADREYSKSVSDAKEARLDPATIASIEETRRGALSEEDARHEAAVNAEDELHAANVNRIVESGGDDINDLILREDERHALCEIDEKNLNLANVRKANAAYDIAILKMDDDYEEAVSEAARTRDRAVKTARDAYDIAVDGLRRTRNNVVETEVAGKGNSAFLDVMFARGYFETMHERSSKVDAALETESFARAWYSRMILYSRASTPAVRTFADFERMRCLSLSYGRINSQDTSWERIPFFFAGPSRWRGYGHVELSDAEFHNPRTWTAWRTIESTGWEISTDGFHFLYGTRREVGRIEKIVADIVEHRFESATGDDDRHNSQFAIVRVEFLPDGEPAKEYTDRIDAILDNPTGDAFGRVRAVYKEREDRWKAIDKAYSDAISAASEARSEAVGAGERSAILVMTEAGLVYGEDYADFSGSWAPRFSWIGDNSHSEDEEAALRMANGILDAVRESAGEDYNAAVSEAKEARWNARRACPPICINHRMRFSANIPVVGQKVYDESVVEVVTAINIFVVYKPKSHIGMDLSEYRKELSADDSETPGQG